MLLFYIGRLRVIWSSFACVRCSRQIGLQVGRFVVDFDGGHGIRIRNWRLLQ